MKMSQLPGDSRILWTFDDVLHQSSGALIDANAVAVQCSHPPTKCHWLLHCNCFWLQLTTKHQKNLPLLAWAGVLLQSLGALIEANAVVFQYNHPPTKSHCLPLKTKHQKNLPLLAWTQTLLLLQSSQRQI
jgi:hypothetical protein